MTEAMEDQNARYLEAIQGMIAADAELTAAMIRLEQASMAVLARPESPPAPLAASAGYAQAAAATFKAQDQSKPRRWWQVWRQPSER